MCSRQNLHNKEERKNPTESTSVVLAKYPPKVKSENVHNFRVPKLGEFLRTLVSGGLGFYSNVEPTLVFLVEKVFPYGEDLYKCTYIMGFLPYRDFID